MLGITLQNYSYCSKYVRGAFYVGTILAKNWTCGAYSLPFCSQHRGEYLQKAQFCVGTISSNTAIRNLRAKIRALVLRCQKPFSHKGLLEIYKDYIKT
jgi:hypothetical protein